MPMDRQLYPPDWEQIAERLKEAANWTCENCGAKRGEMQESRDGWLNEVIITVAHINHDPQNPDAELVVWCSACHLSYDSSALQRKRKQIARGQGILPGMEEFYPSPQSRRRRNLRTNMVVSMVLRQARARATALRKVV